ncbi:hypothetical protein SAMN04487760_1129 [Lachnospiraceae bacterium G41]|nr:hypothetical protein SAMN04487760_1129 [Lachnospiraceae bacterium G41]
MKKLINNIKEMINFYKESIIILLKFPISIILLLLGFVLAVIAYTKHITMYAPFICIQIVGWIIIFIIFIIEIAEKENYKIHLTRVLGVSLAWFVASAIFVDFKNEVDIFFMIYKLYTSWEYILIGCILYDFMVFITGGEAKNDKSENETVKSEIEETENAEIKK